MSHNSESNSRSMPSDPTGESSEDSSSMRLKGGRRLTKRQQLELKRMRNRQAAKKSRKLKKDHFSELQKQNLELREENCRLQMELDRLKLEMSTKRPMECEEFGNGTLMQPTTELMNIQSDGTQKAQKIVQDLEEALEKQRVTEDDVNFERLTNNWVNSYHLSKLFMIVFVLLTVWLSNSFEPKKSMIFGVQCVNLPSSLSSQNQTLCQGIQ